MYFEFPGEKLFRKQRSYFPGEAIFGEKPFSGQKPFSGRSHFWGEAVFGEKPFLGRSRFRGDAIFQKKISFPSLVKNVPSHFPNQAIRENLLCHLKIRKIPTLHRIFEIRKESCWVASLIFKQFFPVNCFDNSQPCQH